MEKTGIVILSRYEKYLDNLMGSLFALEPEWRDTCHIVIGSDNLPDGCKNKYRELGIHVLEMPRPFIYARNVNRCVAALPFGINFMLINDDTKFQTQRPITTMAEIFKSDHISKEGHQYALICPAIIGAVGNLGQTIGFVNTKETVLIHGPMSFVAAMFSREAWDAVGNLDESFSGYGYEDDDWCVRAEQGDYYFAVTQRVYLKHGYDLDVGSSSWNKEESLRVEAERNEDRFWRKWPNARRRRPIDYVEVK